MLETIKEYLIQVGLKKYAPIAAMAGLTALGTFMAAHAGMLESWGVTYGNWPFVWPTGSEPSGPCILIELDTTSTAAIAALVGLVTMMMRGTEHHVATVLKPTEQAAIPPKES